MKRTLCAALLLCGPAVAQDTPKTTVAGSADFKEQASNPAADRAGFVKLFAKTDGNLYFMDDTGSVTEIGPGGGGGGSMTGAEILAELLDVDGADSLLDADLLDGVEGAGYALVDLSNVTSIDADTLDGIDSGAFALASDYEAADLLALLLTVDGAGSTLDADTLDGLSSAAFVLASDYEAGDVLALILGVDGEGSTLDADTLDGLTSADFALDDLSNVGTIDADTLGGNATLTDAQVSDTLTCSALVGAGSTSGAVDLATAEVAGTLPEARGGTGATSLAAAAIDADTVDGFEGADLALDVESTTYAASVDLDFAMHTVDTVTLTGDLTLTTSNLSAGQSYTLRIVGDGSERTLTLPSWAFIGEAAPATIAANKTGLLSLLAFGATDADVVAAWAVEP